MVKEFFQGVTYVARGCSAFYGDRRAWRYAAMPLGILLVVYLLGFWGIIRLSGLLGEWLNELWAGLPSWLCWLHSVVSGTSYLLGAVVGLLLLGTTFCMVYEIFGGFFFDALVEYHERKRWGRAPAELSLAGNIRSCADALLFACKVLFYNVALVIVSLFFPVAGQILLVAVMGYYLGVSYMICSAGNCGLRISELLKALAGKRLLVTGFGVAAYLLLLVPFATIFLLPGLVLGGVELFHEEEGVGLPQETLPEEPRSM